MEIKRTANWAESISSILRKTELNLLRLQRTSYLHDEFTRPPSTMTHLDLSMDQRQRPTLFEPDDNASLIQQELAGVRQAIERLVSEKYKQHQNEMRTLSSRVADIEDKQMAFEDIKDELQNAFLSIGRKSFGDTRKFDENTKNYVTKEDLKTLEESFQNIRQSQINQLEIQIRDLRKENSEIKDLIYEIVDEKMKETAKKSVSPYELKAIKEEIQSDTNFKIKEVERKLCNDIEEVSRQHSQNSEDYSKFLKQNIGNVHSYASEELGKLKKELKLLENSVDTQDIEIEIEGIKKRLEHMSTQSAQQDLSIFVTREEFNQLGNIRRDLKQLEAMINKRDYDKELETLGKQISNIPPPQDLSIFVTREEFNQLGNIRRDLKQLETMINKRDYGKELETLRKQISNIPPPQDLSNFVTINYLNEQLNDVQQNHEVSNQFLALQLKAKEQNEVSAKLANKVDDLEHRLIKLEENESSSEISLDLGREEETVVKKQEKPMLEVLKPEESKEYSGLATFGKSEENKEPELVAISFNNLGESDDDSQGFVSPMISPMNQVVTGPIGSAKPAKKFQFSEPPIIQEESHEEESSSPHPKSSEPRKDLDEYINAFSQELIRTELEDSLLVIKEVIDRQPKPKVGQKHEKLLPKRK
ncbi:unnamed protein product [Blepharisma stoltei]|uniref:Uncharacterized protein n=1 Tax=Blepharisma stoltei TaxID=1481888 RepID=A0AAU9ILW3_9CILI|nr:unnamed protein product [Blepharisma stoltei]